MDLVGKNASISFKFGKTSKYLGNHPFAKLKLEFVCFGADADSDCFADFLINDTEVKYFSMTKIPTKAKGVTTLSIVTKVGNDSSANKVQVRLLNDSFLSLVSLEVSVNPFPKVPAVRV